MNGFLDGIADFHAILMAIFCAGPQSWITAAGGPQILSKPRSNWEIPKNAPVHANGQVSQKVAIRG